MSGVPADPPPPPPLPPGGINGFRHSAQSNQRNSEISNGYDEEPVGQANGFFDGQNEYGDIEEQEGSIIIENGPEGPRITADLLDHSDPANDVPSVLPQGRHQTPGQPANSPPPSSSPSLPPPQHYMGSRKDPLLELEPRLKVRGTVLPKHIPLAKCRVLYLGCSEPGQSGDGVTAMQAPLKDRYPIDSRGEMAGVDAWMTAYSTGLHMVYIADPKSSAWFPIQSLCVCAAVKCVVAVNGATGERAANFEPLDSRWAKQSSHPALFSAIMRTSDHKNGLVCHIFICKSDTAAMALVQSATHAYQHREGWALGPPVSDDEQENKPPSNTQKNKAEPKGQPRGNISQEFFQTPPPQGYFYTTKKELVKKHKIFGESGSVTGQARSLPPTMHRSLSSAPVGGRQTANQIPQATPMPFHTMRPMLLRRPPPRMAPPRPQAPPMMIRPGTVRPRMIPPPYTMRPPMGVTMMVPRYNLPAPIPLPPPPPMMYPPPPPMGLPVMPRPPPNYFSDWNEYGGMPVAVLGDTHGRRRHTKKKHRSHKKSRERSKSAQRYRSKPQSQPPPYRSKSPPRESRPERRSTRSRNRSQSPHSRKYYSDYSYSDYSSEESYEERSPRRYRKNHQSKNSKRYSSHKRGKHYESPSDESDDYSFDQREALKARQMIQDLQDQSKKVENRKNRAPSPDLYNDPTDDLEIFAEHYRKDDFDEYPREYNRHQSPQRQVEYVSSFNPEIVMKSGNRDLMREQSPEMPRRFETPRSPLGRKEERKRLPRNDHGFGRSIKEEQRILGDSYRAPPNPYKMNDYSHEIVENDIGYGYSKKIEKSDNKKSKKKGRHSKPGEVNKYNAFGK